MAAVGVSMVFNTRSIPHPSIFLLHYVLNTHLKTQRSSDNSSFIISAARNWSLSLIPYKVSKIYCKAKKCYIGFKEETTAL
jgi:hypothetical protein